MTVATNPANQYCDINDVRDVLSQQGVQLAVDDDPPSTWGRVLDKAGNRIDSFLFKRYDPDQLILSDLVRDWAAGLAAYYLRIRRGNPVPDGIAALYQEIMEGLKEVRSALTDIPGIAPRCANAPGLSVKRSTLRPYPRTVVETSQNPKGAGIPAGPYQHRDPWDAMGANAYIDWQI